MSDAITTRHAAQIIGLGETRCRQLDDALTPTRTETGIRIYSRRVVERFAACRDSAKAAARRMGKR